MDAMSARDIVEKVTDELQRMAYRLSDLADRYDAEEQVFFLVAEQLHINAMLPHLDDRDKRVFEILTKRAQTVLLPKAFDPRSADTPKEETE